MESTITVAAGRPELDARLSDELDAVNAARTAPVPAAEELPSASRTAASWSPG